MITNKIQANPQLLNTKLYKIISLNEFKSIVADLTNVEYFWQEDKNLMDFVVGGIEFNLKKSQDIYQELEVTQILFDLVINSVKANKIERLNQLFKSSHLMRTIVKEFVSKYFETLNNFSKEVDKEVYNGYVMAVAPYIEEIQTAMANVLNYSEEFSKFKEELGRISENSGTNELVVLNKTLPKFAKLKANDWDNLIINIGQYSYEDALTILDKYITKYGLGGANRYIPNHIENKILVYYKFGIEKYNIANTTVDLVLEPSSLYPNKPYFPFKSETEEDFGVELKSYLLSITDNDFLNHMFLHSFNRFGKIDMKVTVEEAEKIEGYIDLVYTKMNEVFDLTKQNKLVFDKADSLSKYSAFLDSSEENLAKINKTKMEMEVVNSIIVEEIDLKLVYAMSILAYSIKHINRNRIGAISLKEKLEAYPLYIPHMYKNVNETYKVDSLSILDELQPKFYLHTKDKDVAEYKKVLHQFAQNKEICFYNIFTGTDMYIYQNQFFVDVLVYKLENNMANEKEFAYVLGKSSINQNLFNLQFFSDMKKDTDTINFKAISDNLINYVKDLELVSDLYVFNSIFTTPHLPKKYVVYILNALYPNTVETIISIIYGDNLIGDIDILNMDSATINLIDSLL